jgi:D-cysteine desulfhydrase family pyridoxal phosphate-dependent enzyme
MSLPQSLQAKLDASPRLSLANYPTPLEFLPRLSQEIGRDIFIKRDDLIGPGLGGNKTRKLEYFLADAVRQGSHKVVTFGGLQSNHARITAASARLAGLEPHLFFFERRPVRLEGNLLVDELLGARLHFIPLGAGGNASMTLEATIRLVHLIAWLWVGPHYFIPVGGHSWLGCLGYVRAALEIDQQARSLGIENAWLVVAAGTGGTLAGLLAGLALSGSTLKPLGIDVGKLWKDFPASIARSAEEICERLGNPILFKAKQIPIVEREYVGDRYAVNTPACLSAIHRLAQLEGILLDPIYTSKAFAGLLDLMARGQLGKSEPVIFLHTGGLPGIFAFGDEILEGC